MKTINFYDKTPFHYGYSSKEDIVKNMHPILKRLIINNKEGLFCDIGCGGGRNLVLSIKYASKVIGVDLSKVSLNHARELIKSNKLELKHGSNLDIPLQSNIADLVISDGVCHHTGDTKKAIKECIRLLKPNGEMYLAVYKKYRYYPLVYFSIGYLLRILYRLTFGKKIIEHLFVKIHYLLYRFFKRTSLTLYETRNIFFDYFLTPIATFQSRSQVSKWVSDLNANVIEYDRTSGNCHVFVIKKNE